MTQGVYKKYDLNFLVRVNGVKNTTSGSLVFKLNIGSFV